MKKKKAFIENSPMPATIAQRGWQGLVDICLDPSAKPVLPLPAESPGQVAPLASLKVSCLKNRIITETRTE